MRLPSLWVASVCVCVELRIPHGVSLVPFIVKGGELTLGEEKERCESRVPPDPYLLSTEYDGPS